MCSPVDEWQDAAAYMLYPVDTPENAQVSWETWNDKSADTNKRMSVCDSCVELLSHIVENARRALEARGRQSILARSTQHLDRVRK